VPRNRLDQASDIAGSSSQASNRTLTDETSGLGALTGTQGAATISSISSGVVTLSPSGGANNTALYVSAYYVATNSAAKFSTIGSGHLTIEFWVKFPNTLKTTGIFFGFQDSGNRFIGVRASSDQLNGAWNVLATDNSGVTRYNLMSSTVAVPNAWAHVAIVRSSTGTLSLYINGVAAGSMAVTGNGGVLASLSSAYIFLASGAYYEEVRISNTLRYTGAFTPPAVPFTNDANTLLLMHCDGSGSVRTSLTDSSSNPVSFDFSFGGGSSVSSYVSDVPYALPSASSAGRYIQISGAVNSANNGTFLLTACSGTSASYVNAAAVSEATMLTWQERLPYSLQDDLDFMRTDRAAIKGVAFDQAIPTFQRPTAVGTNVSANLANIAGKTTDAQGFIVDRVLRSQTVTQGTSSAVVTSAGNLKHATSTDKSGVPCFDLNPYTGDFSSCYVGIQNHGDSTPLTVKTGAHAGEKIFGISKDTGSTSPNSFTVAFYSVPVGGDVATQSSAYTWESGQPTVVDIFYGYFQRLDMLTETSFRLDQSIGMGDTTNLRQDITDLQTVMGTADAATSLSAVLTNTGNNYPFSSVGATPSVATALNALNAQIGDRAYTGAVLSSGQTIAASLQALANNSGSSGLGTKDLFLMGEPTTPGTTYSLTKSGAQVTQEKWARTADSTALKTIDYTYSSGRLTTEVRKVYDTNGTTILAQMTVSYTYTGPALTGQTMTRDV